MWSNKSRSGPEAVMVARVRCSSVSTNYGHYAGHLASRLFGTALSDHKADFGLGQVNSLADPTELLEGECAPVPENETVLLLY